MEGGEVYYLNIRIEAMQRIGVTVHLRIAAIPPIKVAITEAIHSVIIMMLARLVYYHFDCSECVLCVLCVLCILCVLFHGVIPLENCFKKCCFNRDILFFSDFIVKRYLRFETLFQKNPRLGRGFRTSYLLLGVE